MLTRDQRDAGLLKQAQEKVRVIVENELKENPAPYAAKDSPELESLLRKFILAKLAEKAEEAAKKAKKAKPRAVKFTLRSPPPQESESETDDDPEPADPE
jgi:hypothetical protein